MKGKCGRKFFLNLNSQNPLVAISAKGNDEIIVGILSLTELSDLIQQIDLGENSVVAITDSSGTYIAHTNFNRVAERDKDLLFKQFDDFVDNESMTVKYLGEEMMPNVVFVADSNWAVIIYQSFEDLTNPIRRLIYAIVVVSAVVLVLSLLLSIRKVKKDCCYIR